MARDRPEARRRHPGDDAAIDEPVRNDGCRKLVQARAQLQIDMQPDVGSLFGKEGQRLLQRRELRSQLLELGKRLRAHGAVRPAVTDLVEMIRVGDDQRASRQVEHVELDQIDAESDRGPKGSQGVLGRKRGGTAMPDEQGPARRPLQRDHVALLWTRRCQNQASGAATSA